MHSNEIRRIQNRLLEMGKIITAVLDHHGIMHSMFYGTLLGAIRHKGFIPWDDDFDLCIFDDQYEDAITYLKNELPDDMFLEDSSTEPNFFHAWAHVKDLTTRTECDHYIQDNYYGHKGLSIDLYRLKRIKVSDMCAASEWEFIKYVNIRRKKGLMDDDEFDRRIKVLGNVTGRFWEHAMQTEDERSIEREVFSNICTSRLKLERDEFLPLKRYEFEDTAFWGPGDADSILKKFYGDYMEIPPVEKQTTHYSKVVFL